MTEPTTTEMLSRALHSAHAYTVGDHLDAVIALKELHSALTSGSPLPEQWPQAKELVELREKVYKYEEALRTIAESRCSWAPVLGDMAKEALQP